MIKNIIGVLTLLVLFGSCASRESVQYYRGIEQAVQHDATTYEPVLKQDDLLLIIVSAPNPEAARSFSLTSSGNGSAASGTGSAGVQMSDQSYLIDNKGTIEFPVLGNIKLAGLTRTEALEFFKSQLKPYIKEPIITLRILNYKVTVQGEVNGPGIFTVNSERFTLPEALAMAGDLTIYGKRDNILIIREIEGKKSYNVVDITKADFINSPFYYLSQNDIVYVEPNKTRMNGSVIGSEIGLIFGSVSLLITIITLLIR